MTDRESHQLTGTPTPAGPRTQPVECPACKDRVIPPGVLVCEECYTGPTEDST